MEWARASWGNNMATIAAHVPIHNVLTQALIILQERRNTAFLLRYP